MRKIVATYYCPSCERHVDLDAWIAVAPDLDLNVVQPIRPYCGEHDVPVLMLRQDRPAVNEDEAAICRQRGHQAEQDSLLASLPPRYRCKWCGAYFQPNTHSAGGDFDLLGQQRG